VIIELLLAGVVVVDSADRPRPAATVTVTYHGKAVPLGTDPAARLRGDLEELLSGCSLASPATGAEGRLELEVELRYAQPQTFATITPGHPRVQLDQIRLAASPIANEGWPLLYGAGPATKLQFFKCDGAKILETICTRELEGLVPPKVRDSCSLAPRRRAGHVSRRGVPNPAMQPTAKRDVSRTR
jgi:hypothetical protein